MARSGRAAAACAVLFLALSGHALASSFPCCANQVTKEPYSSCTCLEDDTWRLGDALAPGASRHYHWRLTNWALIDVPGDQRPDIKFDVLPCTGSAFLYVTPMQPPFPNSGTARWKSENEAAENSITTKLQYSEYLITVTAGTELTNYSIAAIVDATKEIVPGNGAAVAALPIQDDETILYDGDTMSMNVRFTASDRVGALYRVFAAPRGPGSGPCQLGSSAGGCVLSTVCGLEQGGMVARSPWEEFTPGEAVNVIVTGLAQNQPYVFNVAVKSGEWQKSYVATQGTPTYKRETRAQDDSTVLIIVVVAACVFVLLVILILWARVRLQKAYHRQHHSRTANRFHGL